MDTCFTYRTASSSFSITTFTPMSYSQALVAPIAPKPRDTPNALTNQSPNRQIAVQIGAGIYLSKLFSAGGKYVEAAFRQLGKLLARGPTAAIEDVVKLFDDDSATCLAKLDELYIQRQSSRATNGRQPRNATYASNTISKLEKPCRKILGYAKRCVAYSIFQMLALFKPLISSDVPYTQLLAFKGIVLLTTRYIGLRHIFMKHLSTKNMPNPSQADICDLWKSGGAEGDQQWEFFRKYAAYCISAPDKITTTIEAYKPSRFGYFKEGLCVSNHLSIWISK